MGLEGEVDRSIVDAVISLAHGLRISVVAEGIETETQFEMLRAMGCDTGQGYLFAKPLPAAEATRLLAPSRSSVATRAEVGAKPEAGPKPLRPVVRPRPTRSRARPVGAQPRRRPA